MRSHVNSTLLAIFPGTDRFSRDIEMMTGRYVSVLLRIMWSIVTPLFVTVCTLNTSHVNKLNSFFRRGKYHYNSQNAY